MGSLCIATILHLVTAVYPLAVGCGHMSNLGLEHRSKSVVNFRSVDVKRNCIIATVLYILFVVLNYKCMYCRL